MWVASVSACLFYLFCCVNSVFHGTYNETVEYYTNVVTEGEQQALNYELPSDASFYKGDLSQVRSKFVSTYNCLCTTIFLGEYYWPINKELMTEKVLET